MALKRFGRSWVLLGAVAASCTCGRALADEPARIFLDSRPTNTDPHNSRCELILREIPRQALLVAIEQDLDRPCIVHDATIEPAAITGAGEIKLGLRDAVTHEAVKIDLFDDSDATLDSLEIPVQCDRAHTVKYQDYLEKVDTVVRSHWLGLEAKTLAAKPRPCKFDPSLTSPGQVDGLLETIDFHHAFLAARLTHAAITQTGESPARLAALTRAYAHLGESSRHLFNGQSSAFFARSLVYGQRLTRLSPQSALSWWTRAYAETLFSTPTEAAEHMKQGDDLAAKDHLDAPPWLDLNRSLIHYKTTELYDQIRPTGSSLASYFAFLTVEHAMLPSLPINFARVALKQNPGAVRLEAAISDSSGVSMLHQTTEESPRLLNRMVSQLAQDADAPAVRDATAAALREQFSQPAIITLRDALEHRPGEPGQLLPWSTYAAFIRECEFTDALRRLYFVGYQWSVDADDEIQGWWPLVKDHRYAPMLAVVRRSNLKPDPELVKKVKEIDFKDNVANFCTASYLLNSIGIVESPRLHTGWYGVEFAQGDRTAHDAAMQLWHYRLTSGEEDFFRRATALLEAVSPEHPLVIAMHARTDWGNLAPQADDLSRKFGDNPIVAYALGRGYIDHAEPEKAIPLLKYVVKVAPDLTSTTALAQAYLQTRDETEWRRTWDQYLANSEDFGLDHAQAGQIVANHFCASKRYQEALPYAKVAAHSYSAWGLKIYADVLIGVHNYAEAEKVLAAEAERYGNPVRWYRFSAATRKGDHTAAARAYLDWYQHRSDKEAAPLKLDFAIYQFSESRPDKGDTLLQETFKADPSRYTALILATQLIAKNAAVDAIGVLDKAQATPPQTPRDNRYDLCIEEFRHCIVDPALIPSREGKLVASFADPEGSVQMANSSYIMGRICELRNKADDARWWYRLSLNTEVQDYTFRPLAADALRRLGEDYYK